MTEAGAVFSYRAAHRTGDVETGTVRAEDREAARARIAARGLFPLEVTPADASAGRVRLPADDLALGLRVLATLLESGLPVARALAALEELAPRSWRAGLPAVAQAVREGRGLAAALAAGPLEVPPLVVGVVQAGEGGSGVAAAVRRAAELTERAAATRRAIRGALAYPLILAAAGGASLVLLVGVVLPRFAAILADLGQEMPATARVVLAAADGARAAWLPVLVSLGVLLVAWRAWTATGEGRRTWHAALLVLPWAGAVRRASATSRVAAALAALLESGVPIAPALTHAARAAGDAELEARVLAAREAVIGGAGLARALEAHDAATPTTVRLARAGEEAGRLPAMLEHAATLEGEAAEQWVRTGVRLLEPALILGFGAMVALVAAALLQAVYSVRPVP